MTETANDENRRTVIEFYRLFYNEKRFEEGAQLLADDFANHHRGASGQGRVGMIRDFSHFVRSSAPDFHITPLRTVADGDQVWVHSIVTGLNHGRKAESVDIWRFEGMLIAEHWDVGMFVDNGGVGDVA